MSELRRVNVCFPGSLLLQVDSAVRHDRLSRSAWIREAVRRYLQEKSRQRRIAQMERGYPAMGEENLRLAELGPEEAEAWARYEAFLEGEPREGL
jgi:metal-responsive CopG/Arc/MetJ family transcriptional regulator